MIWNSHCYGKSTTHHSCISHEILRTLGTKRTLALKKKRFQRCRAKGRTCGTTLFMSKVYHLLKILYTSCAQNPPVPFTQLVANPYFLYVTWASGPDQHSPAYCTPNTEYPALFAACAHLWIALLSNLQLPSSSHMARIASSLKHPRRKKLTAGNKYAAVFVLYKAGELLDL